MHLGYNRYQDQICVNAALNATSYNYEVLDTNGNHLGNIDMGVLYFYQQSTINDFPDQLVGENITDFISSTVSGYVIKFDQNKFNLAPAANQSVMFAPLTHVNYESILYNRTSLLNF